MYKVQWVCSVTGSTGQGEPLSFEDATSWAKAMNIKHPEIHHRLILS